MEKRADDLLDWVGLSRWRNNRAAAMSGGQQQRVAIARALAMDPLLVLADEPTGNLDTASANGVFDLMRRLNQERGTSFLVVTHNHDLAGQCDRIIEMVDGKNHPGSEDCPSQRGHLMRTSRASSHDSHP